MIKHSFFPNDVNKKILTYKNQVLDVLEGIEPSDVNWENLEFNKNSKFKRRMLTRFLSGVLLLISFVVIFFIRFQNV